MAFDYSTLSELKNLDTTVFDEIDSFQDADEDIIPIANFIKKKTMHNEYIDVDRIKFLYVGKPKKEGGRFVVGSLISRTDIDKFVDPRYDFFITIYYPLWKDLDIPNKVIQLDRLISGIDMGTDEKPAIKKKQPDSKEFVDNMRFFGPEKVLESSEIVHLACQQIADNQKQMQNPGVTINE